MQSHTLEEIEFTLAQSLIFYGGLGFSWLTRRRAGHRDQLQVEAR